MFGRARTLSANLLCFLQRRLFWTTLHRAQHFEDGLLVCSDSGNETIPIVLGSVDLLRYGQGTAIQSVGHDVIVIFAMPVRQRAQVLCHRLQLPEQS